MAHWHYHLNIAYVSDTFHTSSHLITILGRWGNLGPERWRYMPGASTWWQSQGSIWRLFNSQDYVILLPSAASKISVTAVQEYTLAASGHLKYT